MAKRFLTDITVDGKIYYANVFSQTSDLPSASTYHGMFAHVHATGKAYFAHAGNWVELLDTNTALLDGTGAANKIAFWTDADTLSNDTSLHWDSSNDRLGIGTSSPASKLSVNNGIIRVQNGSDVTYYEEDKINAYAAAGYTILGREGLTLETSTSNTDIILSPTGKVGIGTSSPSVKLDINSTDAIQVPAGTTAQRPTAANGMFRYNTTDNQFEGYTDGAWGAIAGSGGSSGTSTISRDSFSGNGSTVNFTLSSSISDEANTQVYIDGVYQSKLNYSTSGTTLTFSTAPPTGTNNIEVVHISSVTVDSASTLTKSSFTGDGSQTAFTLSAEPTSEDFTFVFVQGVYQEKSTYSLSGTTLTFSTAPQNTYTIEVMSIGAVNVQQTNYLEYDSFTGTGSQTAFTLANGSPTDEKFTMVFIQGVYQEKSTYSLASGVITFALAPDNGYTIEIMSVSGAGVKAVPTVTADDVKYNVSVINSDTNAFSGFVYVFTAALTLTLPALPNTGDSIKISNRSGVATCVLGANGNNIMGSSSNLTLDTASASFELIYSDATNGWVIIGQ